MKVGAGTVPRQRDGLLATIEMFPPQRARSNALVVECERPGQVTGESEIKPTLPRDCLCFLDYRIRDGRSLPPD
jgi:hypothetical protein